MRAARTALVPAGCVLVGGGVLTACSATSSPWPAVLLPAAATALAALPLSSLVLVCSVVPLLTAAVAAAAVSGDAVAVVVTTAATLVAALSTAVWHRQRRLAEERVASARQLAAAVSVVDEVTGCYNAGGLDLLARHVLGAVRRSSGAMHASLVEVGDLAAVAAAGGEDAVTEVVCAVADALRGSTRGADVVGRWSPDVFVVLGPGTGTTPAEMERRLRARILGREDGSAARWACPLTVGSALLEPWDAGGLAELVARAEQDLALRRALRAPSAVEPQHAAPGGPGRPGPRPEGRPG